VWVTSYSTTRSRDVDSPDGDDAPVAPSPPHSTTTTRLDVRRDFVVLRDARDVRDQGAWTRAKSDRRGGGAREPAREGRDDDDDDDAREEAGRGRGRWREG
jgi:hypothetical protein